MYEELIRKLRTTAKAADFFGTIMPAAENPITALYNEAADAIEELSKRIDRAVELYNRGVERSAMYEALVGIAPEPPKEES